MDKIHAMQLFIRVAELESFSRAADTLGAARQSNRDTLTNNIGSPV